MPTFLDDGIVQSLYKRIDTDGRIITYGKEFFQDYAVQDRFVNSASGITSLGVATNASILVVGSGFGYLIKELLDSGILLVVGIDPGNWLWDPANVAEWAEGTLALTANDWLGSPTAVSSLQALPGITGQAKFNWIIDEDAITMHNDTEAAEFILACEDRLQGNVKGRIVHLVTPLDPAKGPGDSSVNWKTMADWKAMAPDHRWFNLRTGQEET